MDDLKTFAKNNREKTGLLTIVKGYSDDIEMEFGLEKCAKFTFKYGKLTTTDDIQIDLDATIQALEQEGTYKYLGVGEGDRIQHAKMKEKVRNEYYQRVRMEAINTLFTPVVTSSIYKTIYYRSKILKDGTDPVCKICGQFQETFDHVVAGSLSWPKLNTYTKTQRGRHIPAPEPLQRIHI